MDVSRLSPQMTKRGKLKIFMGYAAGVGKTYQMLEEAQELKAQRRRRRGRLLRAARPQGHDRKTEGLEIIPRKNVEYRGVVFEEMDTDAILARQPAGLPLWTNFRTPTFPAPSEPNDGRTWKRCSTPASTF